MLLFSGPLWAQDLTLSFLDSAELQSANSVLLEANGHMWLGGNKLPQNTNDFRVWLYRLGPDGQVKKRFWFPGNGFQTWVGMDWIGPGRIGIIIGQKGSNGVTENWMAMVDSTQMFGFQKIEGADQGMLDHCSHDGKGNLLACGFIGTSGFGGNNFWVGRIKPPGILDWNYVEDVSANDHAAQTLPGPDGRLYMAGTVQNQGYNPYVACFDTSGNLIWDRIISTPWNDGARALAFLSDNGICVVGESSTQFGSEFDTELIMMDTGGNVLQQQWLGAPGQEAAFAIQKGANQTFWVGGYSNAGSGSVGPVSPFLMHLSGQLESLGEAFWPQTSPSPVYDLKVIGDSIFYFCGLSNDRAFLLRRVKPVLSHVFVVANQEIKSEQDSFSFVYDPNALKLRWRRTDNYRFTHLKMINSQGRVIFESDDIHGDELHISLPTGLYFSAITDEKKNQTLRFRLLIY